MYGMGCDRMIWPSTGCDRMIWYGYWMRSHHLVRVLDAIASSGRALDAIA
ncbi:MAG: hypothetical protein F6K59_21705 [Moorea sp. SIO3F7]|nr:hypothetical protein [Moorena sp. SIO3F7]